MSEAQELLSETVEKLSEAAGSFNAFASSLDKSPRTLMLSLEATSDCFQRLGLLLGNLYNLVEKEV